MAEWSCSGLQIRVRRFDSDSRLQIILKFMAGWQSDYATVCKAVQAGLNPCPRLHTAHKYAQKCIKKLPARVVKLVDTTDLKSVGS